MHEVSGVRIVHDQDEGACTGRHARPRERGRPIGAIAGLCLRDRPALGEGRRRQRERTRRRGGLGFGGRCRGRRRRGRARGRRWRARRARSRRRRRGRLPCRHGRSSIRRCRTGRTRPGAARRDDDDSQRHDGCEAQARMASLHRRVPDRGCIPRPARASRGSTCLQILHSAAMRPTTNSCTDN